MSRGAYQEPEWMEAQHELQEAGWRPIGGMERGSDWVRITLIPVSDRVYTDLATLPGDIPRRVAVGKDRADAYRNALAEIKEEAELDELWRRFADAGYECRGPVIHPGVIATVTYTRDGETVTGQGGSRLEAERDAWRRIEDREADGAEGHGAG